MREKTTVEFRLKVVLRMNANEIGTLILDAAFEVHRKLGPGLLESTYEACLVYELKARNLKFTSQSPLPVIYNDVKLQCGYRLDLYVENKVIVEIKAIEAVHDIHIAQLLTYLKLSNSELGYLINFNVCKLKDGIKRFVN